MKNSHIVDQLEASIGIDGASRSIVDAVTEVFCNSGMDEIDALAEAGRRRESIVKIVGERQANAQSDGLIHILEICGTFCSEVGGASHPHPDDDPIHKLSKQGRRHARLILERMQSLTPDEFEQFGAALVRSLGASISAKTQQTGDQGIDFVGITRLGEILDRPKNIFKLAHDMQIDFIGQAKHYPNRSIQPSTVRELVGSLELARSRHFSSKRFELLEDLSLRSFSPVFAILITTGRVSRGARQVADKSGIVIRSGQQIATYLSDLGVGVNLDSGEFSSDLFADWLKAAR